MSPSGRRVVFDALMLRSLIITETTEYEDVADELEAFRTAFQNRRFGIVVSRRILEEYINESNKFPPFDPLPRINGLREQGRVLSVDEHQLSRSAIQLTGLPQEHQSFIHDALAAEAAYLITNRPAWLNLSPQTENYGLQIVSPARFVQLEG